MGCLGEKVLRIAEAAENIPFWPCSGAACRRAERARDFQHLQGVKAAGIEGALGADAGGKGRNPFLNMMLAVRHPANPSEALTREEAVIAYTRGEPPLFPDTTVK